MRIELNGSGYHGPDVGVVLLCAEELYRILVEYDRMTRVSSWKLVRQTLRPPLRFMCRAGLGRIERFDVTCDQTLNVDSDVEGETLIEFQVKILPARIGAKEYVGHFTTYLSEDEEVLVIEHRAVDVTK